jgi:hypothetical protein
MAREETKIVLGAVDNVTPTLNRIGKELGSLNKAFGALAGGALVGLTAVVARTVQSLDELGDTANQLNTTSEALSALGFAAQQSGSNAETLERGLTRLNKVLGEAASGNKAAADLFDRLGVSVRDARGKVVTADQAFVAISERFRQYEDGAQEAALATELFGRSAGPELLQLLNQGEAGIASLTDEAERLGAVIGTDTVAAAQELNDNLDKLKAVGTGLAVEVTNVLLPVLNDLAEALLLIRSAGESAVGALDVGFGGQAADVIEDLSLQISRAEAELQALRESYAFVDEVPESIKQQAQALTAFISNTERTLVRLRDAQKKTGDAAKVAAKDTGTLAPPVVATGKAADAAAPRMDRFRQSIERLRDPSRQFYDSLEITRTAMQDLVQDIDVGAVSFDNLGDSLATMNATATEEAQFFAENWQGAVGAAQDAFADFVAGNIRSFEDFGDALEGIARQFLANLVRQFLNTNLQLPTPSFGGGGGIGGGAGGGLGGFNFGGPGAGLGARLGLGAAGVGIAYQGYQQGSPLMGAAGGALAGFQVGGPVGAVIGAVIGGLAAALNDTTRRISVIGDELVGTNGFRNFAPGSTFESRLGGFTFASIDNVTADERRQIGQSVVDFDNTVADLLNADQLAAVTDALAAFNLRLEEGAISAENILGQRFEAILSTFDESTQEFVRNAGDLEDQVAALAEILSRPARLTALLDSLEEANEAAGLSQFDLGLRQITQAFDAAAEQAEQLGASQAQLTRIEELRGAAIERLEQAQRASLDALLDDLAFDDFTEGLDPLGRALARVNRDFDRLREQALALGATQADLDLIERRRTAALREATDAARESVDALEEVAESITEFTGNIIDAGQLALRNQQQQQQFADSLRRTLQGIGDWLNGGASVSSANPFERLQQSQANFEQIASRIAGGDLEALGQFTGGADRFLQQAAPFYGVGSADFMRIEDIIRNAARPIASINPDAGRDAVQAQLVQVMQALLRFLQGGSGAAGAMNAAQAQAMINALERIGVRTARAT